MHSKIPTIASTKSIMTIHELLDLKRDGKIVNKNGSINCIKIAVEQCWELDGLSKRLGVNEMDLRKSIFKHLENPNILDNNNKLYFPPTGGMTVYIFGDLNNYKKVASRVHDECNGSDVFGTHICSCRPYLLYGIKEAVEYAQNGD